MAVIRYAPQARADLLDIWRGIAKLNESAANRALDRIEAACRMLRDFPELGPRRPDIHEDARVLVVDRWLVLYRPNGAGPMVVRVLDGRRDLTRIDPGFSN